MADKLQYMSGFGNEFATEAESGALPQGQNSPQKAPLGLYTEQLSGTPFTAPRLQNRRTWAYRIRPSVMHKPYGPRRSRSWCGARLLTRCQPRQTSCAGTRRRFRRHPPILSTASSPSPATAIPRCTAAWRSTCMPPTSRWTTASSTTPMANCSSCRNLAS